MSDHDDLPYVVIERRSAGFGTFLLGALIGAGVALLMAPRSGRDLGTGLTSGVRRLRDTADVTVRNVQQSVTDAISGVREQVVGRVDTAREAFDAGREAARESRGEMERRIREARAGFDAGVRAARRPRTAPAALDNTPEEGEDDDVVL
jgi:gas vesicle protein